MTDITIEKMNSTNIPGVKEICDLSFSSPWSLSSLNNELSNERTAYVVVKLGNKVIGFGGMRILFDEADITNIAVHPDYRGHNFGDIIVENLIITAKELGATSMTLEVRVSNTPAINLYKKYNFTIEGTRKNYYENPREDGYIMWNYNL